MHPVDERRVRVMRRQRFQLQPGYPHQVELARGVARQSIDGREPTSVGHAMRILSSYQPGESIELGIMRDQERQTLSIEMPDNRTGQVMPLSIEGTNETA